MTFLGGLKWCFCELASLAVGGGAGQGEGRMVLEKNMSISLCLASLSGLEEEERGEEEMRWLRVGTDATCGSHR